MADANPDAAADMAAAVAQFAPVPGPPEYMVPSLAVPEFAAVIVGIKIVFLVNNKYWN